MAKFNRSNISAGFITLRWHREWKCINSFERYTVSNLSIDYFLRAWPQLQPHVREAIFTLMVPASWLATPYRATRPSLVD